MVQCAALPPRRYITRDEAFRSDTKSVERTEIVIFAARRKSTQSWYVMPICKKTTSEEYTDVMRGEGSGSG